MNLEVLVNGADPFLPFTFNFLIKLRYELTELYFIKYKYYSGASLFERKPLKNIFTRMRFKVNMPIPRIGVKVPT